MSLLYLHIPYCKRICAYCDFFRSASLATLPAALDAMRSEMERRRDYLGGDPRIRTIYFGGGTPSLCAPQRLQRLIDTASVLWDCSSPEEITVEVNPDDVTDDYVAALRDTAVDRISLGIQSFDDGLLRQMDRYDKYGSGEEIFARIKASVGYFESLNVDMIFNFPAQTEDILIRDIEMVVESGASQTTFYPLMASPAVERSLAATVTFLSAAVILACFISSSIL